MTRLVAAGVLLISVVVASGPAAAARQGLVGLQANWRDLETWSQLVEGTKENELGLGLQPTGGAVLAFLGRLSLANPRSAPSRVRVHIAPAYMANSTIIRTRVLTFVADAGTDRQTKLDLSADLRADEFSPGGIIQNALGEMRAADFVRLTDATTLSANVLGFDVVFRPDQIRAMRAFAERLYLTKSQSRD
jgi:hypothetical protein